MLGVEVETSDIQPVKSKVRSLLLDSDLFDAEDSDSGMDYTARSPTPPPDESASYAALDEPGSPSHHEETDQQDEDDTSNDPDEPMNEEENGDDTQMTKSPGHMDDGAKSSIAKSRGRRVQKADVKKIHSESQRIIRDSDVSLPYHKPKPMTLNDFFSRKPSNARVPSVKSLKGLPKRQQIACLTQQEGTPTDNRMNQTAGLSQGLPSSKQQSPLSEGTNTPATLKERSHDSSNDVTTSPSKDDVRPDGNSPLDSQIDLRLALDDSLDGSGAEDKEDTLSGERADEETKEGAMNYDGVRNAFAEDTLGRTAASPDTTSQLQEVQDRVGDENQAVITLHTPTKQECESSVPLSSSPANDGVVTVVTPSQVPASHPGSASSQSYRQKLLEASLSKVKTLTPRLSGPADSFIDLDADGAEAEFATPSNPGLNRLMERFVKHTAKSTPRPRSDIKLSVVTKEMGGDGKEDLKLETVAVTIEGEDTQDPRLNIPGAKLLKLKESLQLKMQARREVERQRRKEAYRLDNEDYNEEEEGEMTDKSETDDDEDDTLGEKQKEKKIKTSKFISHEAAVDDEDDEDYRPGLDSGDDENEDDTDGDSYDEDGDEDDDEDPEDAAKEQREDPADAKIFLADTDEENDEEENIKRTASKARMKKKLVLQDEEEEGEDDDAGRGETVTASTLELHLDADDEEDEIGDKTTNQVSPRAKNLDPRPSDSVDRLFLESVSSLEGTTDSSDVDKLGESLVGVPLSAKKGLALEEKTRDLFESASNTDGGTTGSSEIDRTSESLTGRTSFNWSAVKKNEGITSEDSGRDLPRLLDNSSNSLDNSFEMLGSMIPAHQPGGGVRRHSRKASHEGAGDGFTPFSKHQSLLQAIPKSSAKLSELTLPVEDSQDLFRVDTPSLTVAMETQPGAETQSFRFSYEDEETQTQFLDENGFLKLRSVSKPKPSSKKLFSEENESQDQLDELLGLCSGKFTGDTESSGSKIRKGLFSQLTTQQHVDGTQDNMDELLGLCSGTFGVPKEDHKSSLPVHDDADIDNRSESSFHILSDDESAKRGDCKEEGIILSDDEGSRPTKKRKRIRMMDDEDSEDEARDVDDDLGDDDAEEEEAFDSEDELSFLVQQEEQGKKVPPKKSENTKIRNKVSRDFFEQEAELSGSEYGSDEDYDADDMPDELEQEAADMENVGTEDQLREQVNKVHMKTMDDDDARRLRLYKEMYLPDGDLYSDGKGRTRQFRWRHIDDDSQMNLFPGNSDDEGEEDQDEDTQWRMQRFQREQWLNEQKEKETAKDAVKVDGDVEDESSQFDILMKTAVNRKKKDPVVVSGGDQVHKIEHDKKISTPKTVKFRHGSFLKRSKGNLAKIASMVKPLTGNPNASRGSRNVLYQSIAPQVEDEEKKPQLQRSVSESPASQQPKAKKPRLERSRSLARSNSIFSHM